MFSAVTFLMALPPSLFIHAFLDTKVSHFLPLLRCLCSLLTGDKRQRLCEGSGSWRDCCEARRSRALFVYLLQ